MNELVVQMRKELLKLEDEKKKIDEKILDITKLLVKYGDGTGYVQSKLSEMSTARDAALFALDNSPDGIKPREAVDLALKAGFKYSGATPLNSRIGMELHRLYQIGEIDKLGSGRYRRKEKK